MRALSPQGWEVVRCNLSPGKRLPGGSCLQAVCLALASWLLLAVSQAQDPEAGFAPAFNIPSKLGLGVIQANFSKDGPIDYGSNKERLVPAALFGKCTANSKELTLKFTEPKGFLIKVNVPPTETEPTPGESFSTSVEGGKWAWSGTIQIWPNPAAAGAEESAKPNFEKVGPIKVTLEYKVQSADGGEQVTKNETVNLLPADIWLAAGGTGWAERGEDPGEAGKLLQWEVFPNGAPGVPLDPALPVIWKSTLDGTAPLAGATRKAGEADLARPSAAAAFFGREWQKRCEDKRPVVMLVCAAPCSLLQDWVKGASEEEMPGRLAQAFWRRPNEPIPNDDYGVSFRHRGLIWWHGTWEADYAVEASEDAVAETDPCHPPKLRDVVGEDVSLRARYAGELLNEVVKEWWDSNTKGAGDHAKATQLLLVQPGPANHRPPHLDSFVRMWKDHGGSAHAAPVSTLAAIRFAIFDVARDIERKRDGKDTIYDFSKDLTVVPRTGIFYPASPTSGAVLDAATTGRQLAELAYRQLSDPPAAFPGVEKSGANYKLMGLATAAPAVVPALFFHPVPGDPGKAKVSDPASFQNPGGARSIRTDASDGPRGPWPSLTLEGHAMPVFDLPLPP